MPFLMIVCSNICCSCFCFFAWNNQDGKGCSISVSTWSSFNFHMSNEFVSISIIFNMNRSTRKTLAVFTSNLFYIVSLCCVSCSYFKKDTFKFRLYHRLRSIASHSFDLILDMCQTKQWMWNDENPFNTNSMNTIRYRACPLNLSVHRKVIIAHVLLNSCTWDSTSSMHCHDKQLISNVNCLRKTSASKRSTMICCYYMCSSMV
jgi:hypothetical protein